ncbi:MAG: hypothetical protein M0011_13210 [Elusimicrobia bacterium]|nr:hypothetical protein [Elusimicrobiota bacterium]
MKYWFYSEGNILGPYEPAELLALPAFAEESLVCPESSTGDNPGDWRPAAQVAEIAAALSVGSGHMVTAGVAAGTFEYETGFSSPISYFENKELPATPSGYGELLDAIDNVLGAYKEAPAAGKPADTDYDLAEKFDIRLSRIQEELEAARWEKNLLLEKIRMKEMEERKNAARIQELEARLKGERETSSGASRELEEARVIAELKEKEEARRQLEEIRKEELSLKEEPQAQAPKAMPAPSAPQAAEPPKTEPGPVEAAPAPAQPAAAAPGPQEVTAPKIEARTFKSIKPASTIRLESTVGMEGKEEPREAGMTSRQLKSLGQTQPPAYVYGSRQDNELPGPEVAPPGAFKPEALEPLPQQAGGIVYDFTVVTPKRDDVQKFQLETRPQIEPAFGQQPAKPPAYDMGMAPQAQAPRPAPQPAPAPQFQPVQPVVFHAPAPAPAPAPTPVPAPAQPAAAAAPQAQTFSPSAQPEPAPAAAPKEAPAAAEADSPDKTRRIQLPEKKGKAKEKEAEKPQTKQRRGGRTAFIAIMVIFGSIAAGGLGYFFLGEGVSFSEFSMLNLGTKKRPAAMASQIEPKADAAQQPAAAPEAQQPEAAPEASTAPVQAEPEPQPVPAQPPAGENIKKALDIVKNYKLSGGRGTIASWFANSFLSTSGGANEEWTATPLHGDILVVQYRLLRPKQDPLIYQFEVDAAKQDILRGINNNAIELLDSSSKAKSVSAAPAPAKKPARKKAARKASSKEIPILPLPDEPSAGSQEQDPTGFENPQLEPEQVKYLKAQESDEELF